MITNEEKLPVFKPATTAALCFTAASDISPFLVRKNVYPKRLDLVRDSGFV
jgi:hypothetical protein